MKIYWTRKRLPTAEDANKKGQVLATNSGYHGFHAVPYQGVTADKYGEWAPLEGPVDGTVFDRGPKPR